MQSVPRNAQKKQTTIYFIAAGVLLLLQAPMLLRDLRTVTLDVSSCYLPWYGHVFSYGRFRSLEASFANYSPPIIYLFSLLSFLDGIVSRPVLLKALNLPFILASGWLTFDISRVLGCSRSRALAVASLLMVAPEVWRNSLRWGQYDIIYTCFLLAFYRLVIAKKPTLAMILFGTAFAFKLQAVFAAPVLLALLLTGEVSLWQCAFIPVMYILWMAPAHLAGRPWKRLLLVYVDQFDTYPKLSVDAPNFYFLLQTYVSQSWFGFASKLAMVAATAASLLIVGLYWRRRPTQTPEGLATAITLCLLIVPYMLPRMHERYFFAGDVLAIVLLAIRSNMWLPALLLQAAAYLTYRQYFLNYGYALARRDFILPSIMLAAAVVLIARQLFEEGENHVKPYEIASKFC